MKSNKSKIEQIKPILEKKSKCNASVCKSHSTCVRMMHKNLQPIPCKRSLLKDAGQAACPNQNKQKTRESRNSSMKINLLFPLCICTLISSIEIEYTW